MVVLFYPEVRYVEKKLPQEGLKLIACGSMLVDHFAAVFSLGSGYRIIGRIAFPIYCFLLVEGVVHTKNHVQYGLRLLLCAILSELPFDWAFSGGWNPYEQSVMITLLFGFLALEGMRRTDNLLIQLLIAVPFALAAELLQTDYGGMGVLLIVLFGLSRELDSKLYQTVGMLCIFFAMNSVKIRFLGIRVPIEVFAIAAMIPISFYSGEKCSHSKLVSWMFYSFYPLHFVFLGVLRMIVATG